MSGLQRRSLDVLLLVEEVVDDDLDGANILACLRVEFDRIICPFDRIICPDYLWLSPVIRFSTPRAVMIALHSRLKIMSDRIGQIASRTRREVQTS